MIQAFKPPRRRIGPVKSVSVIWKTATLYILSVGSGDGLVTTALEECLLHGIQLDIISQVILRPQGI